MVGMRTARFSLARRRWKGDSTARVLLVSFHNRFSRRGGHNSIFSSRCDEWAAAFMAMHAPLGGMDELAGE